MFDIFLLFMLVSGSGTGALKVGSSHPYGAMKLLVMEPSFTQHSLD